MNLLLIDRKNRRKLQITSISLLIYSLFYDRLVGERGEFEASYKNRLCAALAEVDELAGELAAVRAECERVRAFSEGLLVVRGEHEQLKVAHGELTAHYEQLYEQAADIVNGKGGVCVIFGCVGFRCCCCLRSDVSAKKKMGFRFRFGSALKPKARKKQSLCTQLKR